MTGYVESYSALLVGNSVLVVATKDHRQLLTKSLQRLEVNVRNYAREDRFTMCDAEEMLAKFMVRDRPDPSLFLSTVGQLLLDVKKAAAAKYGPYRFRRDGCGIVG